MNVKDRFFECCPNADPSINRTDQQMLSAIRRHEINLELRSKFSIPPPPKEDQENFRIWCEGRRVGSFHEFPEKIKEVLTKAVNEYRLKFRVDKIYLSGSYAEGSWIDKETPDNEVEIRRKVRKIIKISDIDLIPVPYFEHFKFDIVEFTTLPAGRRVLIWERLGDSDEGRFV